MRGSAQTLRTGLVAAALVTLSPLALAPATAAAAGTAIPAAQVHLAGSQTSVRLGVGSVSGSGCSTSALNETAQTSLAADASGNARLILVTAEGRHFAGPITQAGDQLQLDLVATGGGATSHWTLSGSGPQYSGQAVISSGSCVVTKPVSVALAGSGLTVVATIPAPSAAPPSSAAPTPSFPAPTPPPGVPAWLWTACSDGGGAGSPPVVPSPSSLLDSGSATVTVNVGDAGTVDGTLAFDGSGGGGSSIAFPEDGAAPALLADAEQASTCSDPCVVAFDGSGGSGGAIAYHAPAGAPARLTDASGGCSSVAFDGTGGSGSSVVYRGGDAASGTTRLTAVAFTAATPVGTAVAAGRAAYRAPGTRGLDLPLTAAGRSMLMQLKAADASYWTAQPHGQSPPYARLLLTLSFTPATATVAATTGGASVLLIVLVVAVVLAAAAGAVLLRRRRTVELSRGV